MLCRCACAPRARWPPRGGLRGGRERRDVRERAPLVGVCRHAQWAQLPMNDAKGGGRAVTVLG